MTVRRPPPPDLNPEVVEIDPCRVAGLEVDRVARDAALAADSSKAPDVTMLVAKDTRWLGTEAPQYCFRSLRGAWALVPVELQFYKDPYPSNDKDTLWNIDARVELVHVDMQGHVVHYPVKTLQEGGSPDPKGQLKDANCCSTFASNGIDKLALFDFDGDGEEELFLRSTYYIEGSYDEWSALLTFRDGHIEPYAPASSLHIREMEDVTGDRRPDLLVYDYLDGGESCGSGFPYGGNAPKFLAHALGDGTFSLTDADAQKYARAWCPKRPSAAKTVEDVVCAKLYGDSTQTVVRKVEREVAPMDCDRALANKPQKPRADQNYELLKSAAAVAPPFVFR